MNDQERFEALLDLVDPERTADPDRGRQLAVFGLAQEAGRNGFRPTTAGWNLLGARGSAFRSLNEG